MPPATQFINEIQKRCRDEDWLSVMRVIREGMTATNNVRAPRTDGKNDYETTPDHVTRMAAASLLIKCTQQMPGTKNEIEVIERKTPQELAHMAFKDVTRALRVMKEIEDAQKFASERQPIDVTPKP